METRFWAKVDKTETCWLWTASRTNGGYGQFCVVRGTMRTAHCLAYEMLVGPIPEGLELDHLCRVRNCVRPDHLEPVTHLENVRRGEAAETARKRQAAKTHCKYGHLYDEKNTSYIGKVKSRRCRTCVNEREREQRRRKSAA